MSVNQHKLLIIIWNLGLGGIQKRLRDVLNDLSQNYPHVQVTVIVKHRKPDTFLKTLKLKSNVQIEYVPLQNRRLSAISFAVWITYKYLQISPDTVLTFLDHLSVQTLMMRKVLFWQKPRIVLNEGVVTSRYLQLNRGGRLWPYLVKKFYKYADIIIVPTSEVKKDLISNFKVPDSIITIIPNWTLHQPFRPKLKKHIDLLYIARIEEEKAPLRFVEIIALLKPSYPNIKAVLLGDGKLKQKVEAEINARKLRDNIQINPPVLNPEKYIAQSKILVHPSKNEGFPNTILEAGIQKVPVVVSDFAGVTRVLKHARTAYIAQTDADFVQSIKILLSDQHEYNRVAMQLHQLVTQKYGIENQKQFIAELLR